MLTQLANRTIVPPLPTEAACVFLLDEKKSESIEVNFEATFAQAAAKSLNSVPGWRAGDPAPCCRTWICNCTRAVPHGSFL
jgi:hypothetical protein